MLLETWAAVFTRSFQELWVELLAYLPNLIAALLIFFIGWLVGSGLGRLIAQVVRTLKVDNALRNAGVEPVVNRAGFRLDSGAFLGGLVKWFIIAIFLVASLDVLGLNQVNAFLQQSLLPYLPQVIVAVLILLIAAVVADVVEHVVAGAAKASGISSAFFLGHVAKWAIWVFAILAALNQLAVAQVFVQTLFTGIVVAVSLALGLAFGLGGQDAAARYIEHVRVNISHREK